MNRARGVVCRGTWREILGRVPVHFPCQYTGSRSILRLYPDNLPIGRNTTACTCNACRSWSLRLPRQRTRARHRFRPDPEVTPSGLEWSSGYGADGKGLMHYNSMNVFHVQCIKQHGGPSVSDASNSSQPVLLRFRQHSPMSQ